MKKEQIKKLVKLWQTRLKLDHWDITLELVNLQVLPDGHGGDVSTDSQYLNATIRLRYDLPRSTIEHNIVHELLHLHLSAMHVVAGTPEHTAEEQAVQIITRVIIGAYYNRGNK